MTTNEKFTLARGSTPESWACVDCGINTHPGGFGRERLEQLLAADWNNQGIKLRYGRRSEVYMVKSAVWKASGMADMDGCLCIGCLEKRIGRTLAPTDFDRRHPFHLLPGTERLINRRDGI